MKNQELVELEVMTDFSLFQSRTPCDFEMPKHLMSTY
jgi:hypothetical protein